VSAMSAKRLLPLLTDSSFIVLALYFAVNYTHSLLTAQADQGLLFLVYQTFFLIFQLLSLVLFLLRRNADVFSSKVEDYACTLLALGLPMFFRPESGMGAPIVGLPLEFAGAVVVLGSFLSLNRSFGIAPENRGIKTGGLYRIVRHPMYAGYLLTEAGFVLSNSSTYNTAIFALVTMFLVLRLLVEERFLKADSAYEEYARKTPWRLIPFIF
jgi:protein-S-isoprenylcysteine O-methyltransferase Ste14